MNSFVEGTCEEHPRAACVRGSEKVLAFEDTGHMHMATFFGGSHLHLAYYKKF